MYRFNLANLKACMKVWSYKVFGHMLKSRSFKFLLVQRTALTFRFLWLENKQMISFFVFLHSFKVVEVSHLIFSLMFDT
jgi:hypothetical protein